MMENFPLVSVIIPCYNVSPFVKKAIHSILNQTYPYLEILIVDDASTDDTLEKIKSVQDKRIKVFEFKENTKKIGAVNTALAACKGEYIAFQDADDWSEPDRIERQVKQFFSLDNLGICFTNYRYVGAKATAPNNIALTDQELKDEFLKFGFRSFTHLAPTMCATMMISRDVLHKTKGYHPYFTGRVAEDIHWVFRILKEFTGYALEEPLYNILSREGSLTHSQFAGKNIKAAYSWHLLSKIIYKEVHEHLDLLCPSNEILLRAAELEACEDALAESIKKCYITREGFLKSKSYKVGKFFLTPLQYLRKFVKSEF